MMRIDARLPLRFGSLESRTEAEAVLSDQAVTVSEPVISFDLGAEGHGLGCACCVPRSGAARALATLFRQRATGPGRAFQGVLAVVSAEGEASVRAALSEDVLVAGRYRLADI